MIARDHDSDTISAIATPPGEGGVGVIRLSGPKALSIVEKIFRPLGKKNIGSQKNFTARYGHILLDSKILDDGLLLLMRGPKSYTGEDVAEIQMHGGPAVMRSVLLLTVHHGARPATPGEFTKRAFLNGRLDLVQAEAVLDLIEAKTERTARWAASQLDGDLSKKMRSLKDRLLEILVHLEAAVDFPEDSTDSHSLDRIGGEITSTSMDLEGLLKGAALSILAKRGLRVALWGRPNTGKSSLLNTLTGTDRVIVHSEPGTTRDVVEEETVLGGFPIRFVDTAGIQDTEHPVEREGIEHSRKAMSGADLVLYVIDSNQSLMEQDNRLWKELAGREVIIVLNKSDLSCKLDMAALKALTGNVETVRSSSVSEGGDAALRKALLGRIVGGETELTDEPVVQSLRQKEHLEKALECLIRARKACSDGLSFEFIASDIRLSLDHLGRLVGEVVTDDMLEILFSRFCIGK